MAALAVLAFSAIAGLSIYLIEVAPDEGTTHNVATAPAESPVAEHAGPENLALAQDVTNEQERSAIDELKEIRRATPAFWPAMSKTAMSITGDIRLSEYLLTFENDQSIEVWEVDESEDMNKRLYQVLDQSNPSLLYDNFLCDQSRPVDYILAETSEAGQVLTLTMIYDNTPYFLRIGPLTVEDVQDIASPFTGNVLGACAIYTYAKE